jgi:uncharacterized membrane protein YfcA
VVALALPGVLLAVITATRDRGHIRWRTALGMLAAVVAGLPLGLVLMRLLDDRWLTIFIAGAVLACSALVWRNPQLPHGYPTIGLAGLLAGVLSTAAGPSGPPLVAAFQTMGYGQRELRATIAAVFSAGGVLSIGGFAATGALTGTAVLVGSVATPSVLVGWRVGNILFDRIDGGRFRQAVLVVLLISCLLTVAQAVNSH